MATIMGNIKVIGRCEGNYCTQKLAEDLPGEYHNYILTVGKHPGMSQDKIAKHLYYNKSSVTRHLAQLEKNGYVTRTVSEEDKRELLVYPTQKLLDILPKVQGIVDEWYAFMEEGISEEELAVFRDVLQRISDKARKMVSAGDATE